MWWLHEHVVCTYKTLAGNISIWMQLNPVYTPLYYDLTRYGETVHTGKGSSVTYPWTIPFLLPVDST
jgi:hypothetical protein